MQSLFIIFSFAFGAIIASFVNVVALRHGTGQSIGGRSKCVTCNTVIAWYDLVPVASFMVLGGRCRSCKSRLSLRYPAVEVVVGAIFAAIAYKTGIAGATIGTLLFYWLIAALCAIIVLYDIRHKIIPDRFVAVLAMAALGGVIALSVTDSLTNALLVFAAGPVIALPFFLLWLVSKGRWMGLGDAKLALPIGWLLGLRGGFVAIMLAFWIGAVVSVVFVIILRAAEKKAPARLHMRAPRLTMKSEIPFAPFLVLGTLLVFLFDLDFWVLFEQLAIL